MTKQTKNSYRIVIKDLRSQINKCKDKSIFCPFCITRKVADDLEQLLDMFKDL